MRRLLEPADPDVAREPLGEGQRLLAVVGTVGVDEELDLGPDRLAGPSHPAQIVGRLTADLHLNRPDAAFHPAAELRLELVVAVRGEAAAAVDRDLLPPGPEQMVQRDLEQTRLEVPECRVDRGDGARRQPAATVVADRVDPPASTPTRCTTSAA